MNLKIEQLTKVTVQNENLKREQIEFTENLGRSKSRSKSKSKSRGRRTSTRNGNNHSPSGSRSGKSSSPSPSHLAVPNSDTPGKY